MTEVQNIEIVGKVKDELVDNCDKRHRLIVGGRGKGASWSIARILLLEAMREPLFVACVREVQKTIKHSVKKLLDDTIKENGWEWFYKSQDQEIKGINGSLFAFFGLHDYNADNIKSLEGANRCWVAESQTISRRSINILRPTIRDDNAVFWWDFNPRFETDPVYLDYIVNESKHAKVLFLTWRDNKWFNKSLREEMEDDYDRDEEEAKHIWEGEIRSAGDLYVCPSSLVDVARRNIINDLVGDIVVGADIAHQGGDEIVFYKRHGNKVIDTFAKRKMSAPETKRALKAFTVDSSVLINIDNGSLGMAIADDLEEDGWMINRVNFGGRPIDTEHYDNATTEMYFQLRDKLPFIDMPENDEELRNQLIQRKYAYITGNRGYEVVRIESKDDFAKHANGINKSPDRADAMVLCFYDAESFDGFGETFDKDYSIF